MPYEVNLQQTDWFINLVEKFHSRSLNLINDPSEKQELIKQLVIEGSSVFVKLCYASLFYNCCNYLINIMSKSSLFSLGKNDASNKR